MRNIIISDGTYTVALQNDLVYEIEYEEVGTTKVMASGRMVKDVIGFRPVLIIPTGYVELSDVVTLKRMINSGKFLRVTYPGVGGDESRMFHISPPRFKSFRYSDDGVGIWYGVELHCQAQEVE